MDFVPTPHIVMIAEDLFTNAAGTLVSLSLSLHSYSSLMTAATQKRSNVWNRVAGSQITRAVIAAWAGPERFWNRAELTKAQL